MIKIARYKNTRHWAVWKGKQLVAVVCYKKGAQAIKTLLAGKLTGQGVENLAKHNLKTDLGAIERLARSLHKRIAATVSDIENLPR